MSPCPAPAVVTGGDHMGSRGVVDAPLWTAITGTWMDIRSGKFGIETPVDPMRDWRLALTVRGKSTVTAAARAGRERPTSAVPRTTAAPSATCTVSEAAELTARIVSLQMRVLWSMRGGS